MRMKTKSAFALASVLTLALASCAGDEGDVTGDGGEEDGDGGETAAIETVDELVIGLVPATESATEAEEENAEALAEQLSEALDGFPVEIFFAEGGYSGAIQGMNTGDVQILMTGPVGMIQAEDNAGGVPILQSVRFGSPEYVTQWFTNDPDTYCLDEPVANEDGYLFCNDIYDEETGELAEYGPMGEDALELIEDGTTVSYVDEGSASGYYFPQTQLNQLGVEVDGQFAGGHDNSVLNVLNGQMDIGTSFDDARTNVEEEHPEVGEELVVFAWAGPIPNDGIVVSGDFTEEEQEIISDAFLSFGEEVEVGDEEEGGDGDPLYQVYEIEGLAPVDEAALDVARDVYNDFGDEAE